MATMRNRRLWGAVAAAAVGVLPLPYRAAAQTTPPTKYWDLNDVLPGAGTTTTPTGTWDGTAANWNTDATGVDGAGVGGTIGTFATGDAAVFSAGSDATGTYTVNITGTQTAASILIEDGIVQFRGGTGSAEGPAGTTTVTNGATLSIDSSLRLGGTGPVVLNGGTLLQTNPATAAGSFIPAGKEIQIGAAGGTVSYATSGTGTAALYRGTITGAGNTLTKTGPGEFRYEGAGTANSTFVRLVVVQGLFRVGNGAAGSTEVGFGAAPAAFTADAITLNGGGIGGSLPLTLSANRGITIGVNGGTLNVGGGSLTIPGAITGSGVLTVTGTVGAAVLNSASNNTTFTGALVADGLMTLNQSLTVKSLAGGTAGSISVAGSRTLLAGGDNTDTTYAGRVTGSGAFRKVGTGTLTMSPTAGEWTNTGGVNIDAGTIRFGSSSAGFAATAQVAIAPGATLDMNGVNDSFGSLTGGGRVIGTSAASTAALSSLTLSGTAAPGATFAGTLAHGGFLRKSGTGVQILGGTTPNTYGGLTSVYGGVLGLNKTPGVNAIAGDLQIGDAVGATPVPGTGTLRLLAPNQIPDAASLAFAAADGGVLDLNGQNEALGTLTLGKSGTIDFATAAVASILAFAPSGGTTWDPAALLTVANWDGTPNTGGGTEQLRFGSSAAGLTPQQVSQIRFTDPANAGGFLPAMILDTGEVVAAVPEPGTAGLIAAVGGLLALRRTRRRPAGVTR